VTLGARARGNDVDAAWAYLGRRETASCSVGHFTGYARRPRCSPRACTSRPQRNGTSAHWASIGSI